MLLNRVWKLAKSAVLRKTIKIFALPTAGLGLVGFGIGGKQFPTINAMIGDFEQWLTTNSDYPSLVVTGIVILVLWVGYQINYWWFVSRKEKWRGDLISLLKEGIAIRNEGETAVHTANDAATWIAKADDWCKRTYDKITKMDETGAEDYVLLDASPPPRILIKTSVKDHSWHYQHHDYRLVKLRELVSYHRRKE